MKNNIYRNIKNKYQEIAETLETKHSVKAIKIDHNGIEIVEAKSEDDLKKIFQTII
jgi:hypothetical protein